MSEVKSSWQHRSEYYEREYHKLAKTLLKIKKQIEDLNLESGWNGKDPETDTGKTNPSG